MVPHLQGNWLRAAMIYLAVSAILHLAWEMLQLPLYTIWRSGTAREIAFAVLHCTAGDLMIAAVSLLIALLVAGNRAWPSERFLQVTALTLIIGMSYTVYSEWANTGALRTWAYSKFMPTVPLLGTGLSPLMQWLVVPALAFAAIRPRRSEKRPSR